MDPLNRHIGLQVRLLRIKAGLTQRALAEHLGVHASYIGPIERGQRQPSLGLLSDIASLMGVSLQELVPGPTPPSSTHVRRVVQIMASRPARVQRAIYDLVAASVTLLDIQHREPD